jgi:undecaprenyl-diphosphatase
MDGRPTNPDTATGSEALGRSRYRKYALLLIFLIMLAVSIGFLDYIVYELMQPLQKIWLFNALAQIGQFLGNRIGSILLVVLVIVLAGRRWKNAALIAGVSCILQSIIVELIKDVTGRLRPISVEEHGVTPGFGMDGNSFPSGHATFAFTLATVAVAFFPQSRRWIYGIATFIAVSRIMLDKHYLSDVAAGALLGCAIGGFFVLAWFPRTRNSDGTRESEVASDQ